MRCIRVGALTGRQIAVDSLVDLLLESTFSTARLRCVWPRHCYVIGRSTRTVRMWRVGTARSCSASSFCATCRLVGAWVSAQPNRLTMWPSRNFMSVMVSGSSLLLTVI